jgi:hypothetical protein
VVASGLIGAGRLTERTRSRTSTLNPRAVSDSKRERRNRKGATSVCASNTLRRRPRPGHWVRLCSQMPWPRSRSAQ